MATTRILLPVEYATLPTLNPATRSTATSGGGPTTNTPLVTFQNLSFNNATDQAVMWTFRLPSDYLSGGSIFVKFSSGGTVGNVVMKAGIAPYIENTTVLGSAVFNAADLSATTSMPSAGTQKEVSWALTMTNVAAGRLVTIFLGRDADNVADTCASSNEVEAVEFEYTS